MFFFSFVHHGPWFMAIIILNSKRQLPLIWWRSMKHRVTYWTACRWYAAYKNEQNAIFSKFFSTVFMFRFSHSINYWRLCRWFNPLIEQKYTFNKGKIIRVNILTSIHNFLKKIHNLNDQMIIFCQANVNELHLRTTQRNEKYVSILVKTVQSKVVSRTIVQQNEHN